MWSCSSPAPEPTKFVIITAYPVSKWVSEMGLDLDSEEIEDTIVDLEEVS